MQLRPEGPPGQGLTVSFPQPGSPLSMVEPTDLSRFAGFFMEQMTMT